MCSREHWGSQSHPPCGCPPPFLHQPEVCRAAVRLHGGSEHTWRTPRPRLPFLWSVIPTYSAAMPTCILPRGLTAHEDSRPMRTHILQGLTSHEDSQPMRTHSPQGLTFHKDSHPTRTHSPRGLIRTHGSQGLMRTHGPRGLTALRDSRPMMTLEDSWPTRTHGP